MKSIFPLLFVGLFAASANASQVNLSQYAGVYKGQSPALLGFSSDSCNVTLTANGIVIHRGSSQDGLNTLDGTPLVGNLQDNDANFQITSEETVTFDLTLNSQGGVTVVDFHSKENGLPLNDWKCNISN